MTWVGEELLRSVALIGRMSEISDLGWRRAVTWIGRGLLRSCSDLGRGRAAEVSGL